MDDFFRKEKINEVFKDEELKNELELEFDNFKKPSFKKDLRALAQLILNLCLTVPGTYPDTPEMGVNIKQYEFELLHDDELMKIQEHILEQVERFVPTTHIAQVAVRVFTDPNSQMKNLGIGFGLATDLDSVQNFFIFFRRNNGNVISKILF
jgi:phage baseplate assembly protein W